MIDSIEESDKSILLISDSYLKSKNCMFEILEVVRNRNYKKKIIPIILSSANKVYSPEERIDYVKYWAEKEKKLKSTLETTEWHLNVETVKDLSVYADIKRSIGDFCTEVSDLLNVSLDELKKSNFQSLLEFIDHDSTQIASEMISIKNEANIESRELMAEEFFNLYSDSKYSDYLKGVLADERKLYNKARDHYLDCVKKDNKFNQARINIANLFMVIFSEYESAEKHYLKAIELEPSNKIAHNNLGILCHYYLKKPQQAVSYYNKAIELDPYYSHPYYNLGNLCRVIKNDPSKAEYYYQKAIDIDQNYGRAFNGLGIINMEVKKKADIALKCFEMALSSDPNRLEYILNIAELYSRDTKNYLHALFYYEHALRVHTKSNILKKKYLSLLKKNFPKKYKKKKEALLTMSDNNDGANIDIEELVFNMGEPVVAQTDTSRQRIIDYFSDHNT